MKPCCGYIGKINMPKRYIGTKVVLAKPMTRGAYNQYRGWTPPEGEDQNVDGFLVEYQDGGEANHPGHVGYISWSPADVFHQSYRLSDSGITFGQAIEALKVGKKVARTGWNGKGMFLYLVPAASYPAQTGAAKGYWGENAMVPYGAYIAMKTVQENVVPWLASQTDVLAEDWTVIG